MNDADRDILARAQEFADEHIGLREYIAYYWQRIKCWTGHHRPVRRWLGGKVCIYCGHIETSKNNHIDAGAYLMCVATGISAASILSLALR